MESIANEWPILMRACSRARVHTYIYTLSCTNSSQKRSHVYITSPGQCEYAPIRTFDFGSGMLA